MASGRQTYAGAYIGTGSALSISKVGFRPTYVRVVNIEDASAMEHMEGMPAATCFKQKGASSSFVSSAAITLTADGFSLGTDADLNTANETCHFIAYK